MIVTPLKTERVGISQFSLETFLDANLQNFTENSILAITSKVIALCEGSVAPLSEDKELLLQKHSDYYLPEKFRQHNSCTITHHAFIGSAGIDESNADGHYVFLPKDAQASARLIQNYLLKRFSLTQAGVIITDSHSTPMRRGASGIAVAYAGFHGIKDYRGTPDLFGRNLQMEQANITDALASAAVLVMGEGDEQTPLALLSDLPHVTFAPEAPDQAEINEFFVPLADDVFFPIFDMTKLTPGGRVDK
ncbi:MAG: coenzyme F420-0:L-glutamate ligase [Patescibacteria group bacterium]